ncbi:hypothetical protein N0V86_006451 [Didymella sp. IMI 355093]|nr:hypothetical protein N0V86_006451 [Didymella sp. IMI 355093]
MNFAVNRINNASGEEEQEEEDEDEEEEEEPLVDKILDSLVLSNFHDPGRDFLPHGCLNNLLTESAIATELHRFDTEVKRLSDAKRNKISKMECDTNSREELAVWIAQQAPRTFAIALQCEPNPVLLVAAMSFFRENGFDDESLPLVDLTPSAETFPKGFLSKSDLWTPVKLHNFREKQWKCLVPVFSSGKYTHNLEHDNYIFPFTKVNENPKIGAFGFVHKVRVHRDHQNSANMSLVAIKEIQISRGNDKSGTNKAWEDEARALESVNKLNHDHIIRCVAAIRRGDNRYFMFPWADGESLRDYWDKADWECPTKDMILEAVTQLRGLADALVSLHNNIKGVTSRHIEVDSDDEEDVTKPSVRIHNAENEIMKHQEIADAKHIRHGDLKPENILRFVDQGTGLGILKIADMGIAKQHIVATQDRKHLTTALHALDSTTFGPWDA